MNSYLFSQAEKNSRFGKLVSDNSSIVQYRSSKANSEEAGMTRGWYHQSQLIINYLVQYLYNHNNLLLTITASTLPQYRYLVLEYSDPAREVIECGVQLARGFSSQEQVDVRGGFSPSCCSTTPIQQQLGKFIQFGSEKKTRKTKSKNRRILTISTNRTSCISQNRSMVFPTGVN